MANMFHCEKTPDAFVVFGEQVNLDDHNIV